MTFQYFISFILVVVHRTKSPILAEGTLSSSRETCEDQVGSVQV